MTSREIEGRLSDLRSALGKLDADLERLQEEAYDLQDRGALDEGGVAGNIREARESYLARALVMLERERG